MINDKSLDRWILHNQQIVQCRKCPRLVEWREQVAKVKRRAFYNESYWGKPVPAFGDTDAKVIVVGLAPGAHGSNRTGRMFTGDASGRFLYPALYRAGFSNQAIGKDKGDGLALDGLLISAICRCVPPANKPTREEIHNCLPYLEEEIDIIGPKGFVALGNLAFQNLQSIYKKKYGVAIERTFKFSHGAFSRFNLKVPWLLASYHPSRQNTQTGKLTEKMFDLVWSKVQQEIN
jgi:uracil-DNA glycosylase